MSSSNTVAVIIPVYNVEKYLSRCVESVLAQTYRELIVILVDDGSLDNCPSLCDKYASEDSRVFVIHQENGGLSAARNAGLDWVMTHANVEWISFVDSDDWIHPEMIDRLLKANLYNKTNISCCPYKQTNKYDTPLGIANDNVNVLSTELFYVEKHVEATIACAKLYSLKLFQSIRFPQRKLHEDEFTTYKVLFSQEKISYVCEPMYFYFINECGITKSAWTPRRMDALEAIQAQIVYFRQNNLIKALRCSSMAYLFNLAKQLEEVTPDYSSEKKYLRTELRHSIWKLRKLSGLSFRRDTWIISSAYPLMRFFYRIMHFFVK